MHRSRKFTFILFFILFSITGIAQQSAVVDTLKAALARAETMEDKVYLMDNLSRVLMNVNLQEAEKYGNDLIRMAEESRNRKLMVKAYVSNGIRCSYMRGQKILMDRSIGYFNQALELAKKNRMEEEIGEIEIRLAVIYLAVPDIDKALNYANQAFSLISTLSNDSLKAEGHNVYGQVYLAKNEKSAALENYLAALRIAENMKAKSKTELNRKSIVLRSCYLLLSDFYNDIGEIDRAIDYRTLAYKELDHITEKNTPYLRVIDINSMGNLFSEQKKYDLAITNFEKSIAMADSLKFESLKVPGYISLLNLYLRRDQPRKALEYMSSPSSQGLKNYLTNFGLAGIIDQTYAVIYTELKMFDSAKFYFNRATPFFEKTVNQTHKIEFYAQLANYYRETGDESKAIEYLLKVKEMGEQMGWLEVVRSSAKNLDSLYMKQGNYQLASLYKGVYYQYKDSIERLNKEKELTQLEAADVQQREDRLVKELEEAKKKRNRIQYFAITIGIVALFILLIMMGMFRVSVTTIKAIGFFVFLLLFEFIFLVFKKNIAGITEGEPWKDLLFMIGLAALLVPLHHWLEHRVINYLTSHNRLTAAGQHIRSRLTRRTNRGEEI